MCVTKATDLGNLRLVNHRLYDNLGVAWAKKYANNRVIYPRYDSFRSFLALLLSMDVACHYVKRIVLVAEGMKVHEHGHDWAWEALLNWNDVDVTNEDMSVMYQVNVEHANMVTTEIEPFLNTGGYRSLLTLLLLRLPNLRTIEIRDMMPGEHHPGWKGPKLLKQLSFYYPDLNTNSVFYGHWQYDTVHRRVTHHKDEFGDDVIEPGAGPQASCKEDVRAAVAAVHHPTRLVFWHFY